jgi:molecular chaperone GrpE (heat shock protein)
MKLIILLLFVILQCSSFLINPKLTTKLVRLFSENEQSQSSNEITSPEIERLNKKLETLSITLNTLKDEKKVVDDELAKLDQEYGSEISRIKKEFSRMKERSYEETRDLANKAKIDALKEVLPITDNYFRAKQVFQPIQTDSEQNIQNMYDNIFSSFSKVISDFGVERVESVGKPFDFNFMEAIMTAPSTEYVSSLY